MPDPAETGAPPHAASNPAAFAWMASSALLFALMNFFARVASAEVPWMAVASARAFVGAGVAFAVAGARGVPRAVRDRRGIWLRSAFGTVGMVCTFYAVSVRALPLGDAVTLLNLAPVFLALFAPLFMGGGETGGRRVWLALPLSGTGVVLVLHPSFLFGGETLGPAALAAAAAAVCGSVASSFAMAMLRRLGPRESPEAIALHFSLVAAFSTLALAAPELATRVRAQGLQVSAGAAVSLVLAGVCAGLAQLCMTRAYALERAARVSSLGYLSVVGSALLGAVAFHEFPTPAAVVGMALVVSGGLVIAVAGYREHRTR